VFDFFVKYAIENVKIKWPNDLYWQDRKAGGILIESVMKSGNENVATWEWAIIGTGININQQVFSAELPNPVSLRQITGKQYNVVKLAKELSSLIYQNFKQLVATGFGPYYEKYNEHLYKRNQIVKLKKDNRVFEALIKGVTETGDLKVQHAIEEDFGFGKVEWVH
jgi:BirA family biotin operon repressor/biotin-[acetyl-CoA-carboxylase] ligase